MSNEAERVAKGLAASMRNALSYFPAGYMDPNTFRGMKRRGLVEDGTSLSPLGLAVRAILHQEQQK